MVKTTRGIIPFIFNISDEEINETIRRYHEDVAKGLVIQFDDLKGMSDIDLRPYAINTILHNRKARQPMEPHNID